METSLKRAALIALVIYLVGPPLVGPLSMAALGRPVTWRAIASIYIGVGLVLGPTALLVRYRLLKDAAPKPTSETPVSEPESKGADK